MDQVLQVHLACPCPAGSIGIQPSTQALLWTTQFGRLPAAAAGAGGGEARATSPASSFERGSGAGGWWRRGAAAGARFGLADAPVSGRARAPRSSPAGRRPGAWATAWMSEALAPARAGKISPTAALTGTPSVPLRPPAWPGVPGTPAPRSGRRGADAFRGARALQPAPPAPTPARRRRAARADGALGRRAPRFQPHRLSREPCAPGRPRRGASPEARRASAPPAVRLPDPPPRTGPKRSPSPAGLATGGARIRGAPERRASRGSPRCARPPCAGPPRSPDVKCPSAAAPAPRRLPRASRSDRSGRPPRRKPGAGALGAPRRGHAAIRSRDPASSARAGRSATTAARARAPPHPRGPLARGGKAPLLERLGRRRRGGLSRASPAPGPWPLACGEQQRRHRRLGVPLVSTSGSNRSSAARPPSAQGRPGRRPGSTARAARGGRPSRPPSPSPRALARQHLEVSTWPMVVPPSTAGSTRKSRGARSTLASGAFTALSGRRPPGPAR
jgi:hypothetical protein